MQFLFFFFEPLRFEELVNQIDQITYDLSALKSAYLSWLIEFCRKSLLFYQSQYRAHSDFTWLGFCSAFIIPDYENPSNFGLEIEWENWKEEYLLNSHYDKYQEVLETLSGLQEITNNEIKSSIPLPTEIVPENIFNRIWFNNLINNPPQVITELRSMSYEKYLQTTHWKKIRSAMFLVNTAVCQANDCNVVGESWYGGSESGLDVHHLSYENRGNERFEDLALLCRHHHELFHSEYGE